MVELKTICPELARTYDPYFQMNMATTSDKETMVIEIKQRDAIAARMLALAEENEELRRDDMRSQVESKIEAINKKQEERQRKYLEDTQKGDGPSKRITPATGEKER